MSLAHSTDPIPPPSDEPPILDPWIRERLGRQLQALYEPVLDEALDPRLAELLQQLDSDKRSAPGG